MRFSDLQKQLRHISRTVQVVKDSRTIFRIFVYDRRKHYAIIRALEKNDKIKILLDTEYVRTITTDYYAIIRIECQYIRTKL